MVEVIDGIGFSTKSGAIFSSLLSSDEPIRSIKDVNYENTLNGAPWAPWGISNMRPEQMRQHLIKCGVLSAGIDAKVRMAVGKGIEPFLLTDVDSDGKETLTWVNDKEIQDWLEENDDYLYSYQSVYNLLTYGWGAAQLMLSRDRSKITRIRATDSYQARLERKDEKNFRINYMYLCSDWTRVNGFDKDRMIKIPILDEGYELEDLQQTRQYEYAILHRCLKNGSQYYPPALWEAAEKWVEVSRAVPEFKKALFENSMNIKYLVSINSDYWKRIHLKWDNYTPEERTRIITEKYNKIDQFLTGAGNAGKSIISSHFVDPLSGKEVKDITIEPLVDTQRDGKLLPDSAAADKQIMFSMFLNPAIWGGNLLGDGASGGAGSGSDIREAFLVQLMLMEQERRMNLKVFNLVKRYNGWSARIEGNNGEKGRLVFRYKSGLLTTLDTGKSTKAAVM